MEPKEFGAHDSDFRSLYERLGFLDRTGLPFPLHVACSMRVHCWRGAEGRYPDPASTTSHIARPWVGALYSRLRLLVLGINLYEYGGYTALSDLVTGARKQLVTGRRRVNFDDPNYIGSLVWHRVAAYALVLAERHGVAAPKWATNGWPPPADICAAFDLLAFANQIKCSPMRSVSAPTQGMWSNCADHVLTKELSILRPSKVLLLGVGENLRHFASTFGPAGGLAWKSIGRVQRSSYLDQHGQSVELFGVPHPSRGGASRTIVDELRAAL